MVHSVRDQLLTHGVQRLKAMTILHGGFMMKYAIKKALTFARAFFMVDCGGFEPPASAMRMQRSTN